ncbi:MAG: S1C family serine protease, partial [Thermoguttaceae bacterium]
MIRDKLSIVVWIILLMPAVVQAADGFGLVSRTTLMAAVEQVAPSVVCIETIGGLDRLEGVLLGSAPTTGLIVDSDGYIVPSAFNFVNKPTSIVVRLSDGVRKAAELVATDHVRMIVLLRIKTHRPLPVCPLAPSDEMRVGQWTIAVGRTFDASKTNVSLGILSAKNRIWGKALQTDAAISPLNYGGPLVDIHGRVMGVIVPLALNSDDTIKTGFLICKRFQWILVS